MDELITKLFNEMITAISDGVIKKVEKNLAVTINRPVTTEEDNLINIDSASKFTDLAKPTMYGLVHQNKIPFYKKGKRLYFSKQELTDWIKSGKHQSKSELENRADEYLSKNRLF